MNRKTTAAAVLLGLGIATFSSAQVIERKGLSINGARTAITAAVEEARKRNTTGVIAVVDNGGNLMAVERIDGTFSAGANIAIGKARTAALFERPTRVFEDAIKSGRTAMVALPDTFFTPLQGGVPLEVDGQIVGAVGVSGAASAQEDEELALAAADALKRAFMPHSPGLPASSPIIFLEADRVRHAFEKGEVLVNRGNYMVHASHRDTNGMAEIHTDDTDIIYVLEGNATFVTGGTVLEPATVAPGEIRGPAVRDGERRTISKGDVVVVPNGVPHWFEKVSGPLDYYVVKVRQPQERSGNE